MLVYQRVDFCVDFPLKPFIEPLWLQLPGHGERADGPNLPFAGGKES